MPKIKYEPCMVRAEFIHLPYMVFKKRNCFKNTPSIETSIPAPKRENTAKITIHSSLLFAVLSLCRRNRRLTEKHPKSF